MTESTERPKDGIRSSAEELAALFYGLGFAAVVRDPESADVVAESPGAPEAMRVVEPGSIRIASARIGGDLVRVEIVPDRGRTGPSLTARQRSVAVHLARGLSNQEIADVLGISLHTVRRHLEEIFRRLQVPSRAAATEALRGSVVVIEEDVSDEVS